MRRIKKFFTKTDLMSNARFRHYENMLDNLRLQRENIESSIKVVELKLHNHHNAVLDERHND